MLKEKEKGSFQLSAPSFLKFLHLEGKVEGGAWF